MKKFLKNNSGFTLVELMVVVAIIGILAAVAIPNYKKYQAKSRTSEAKVQLSSIFAALQSYQGEYGEYATCLPFMGYDQTAELGNMYYSVGFAAANTFNANVLGAQGCVAAAGTFRYDGTKPIGGNPQPAKALAASAITADTFTAAADGQVSADAGDPVDLWSINDTKAVVHIQNGY